jgi:two-component system CheB/CheR fusion protein
MDHTMQSITAMLNAMLDINQIEAGIVQPDVISFNVNDLLLRLEDKFKDQAAAQQVDLRIIPCRLTIATDPALLEQMLTNLLGNALKYTKSGRVLAGCRRQGGILRIEVWDTGIGIAPDQLQTIFDEYHQIDNPARERSRGLGLGLSIVQRLATLLGHKISVRSVFGKGSRFAIEVPRAPVAVTVVAPAPFGPSPALVPQDTHILIIEDDPDISQLLNSFLADEGFTVTNVSDGPAAKAAAAAGGVNPDIILADYNLPGPQTGLDVARDLRTALRRPVPVIIMTGDISTATLRLIADADCVQMNKPMKLAALMAALERLLAKPEPPQPATAAPSRRSAAQPQTIFIVDDDSEVRETMRVMFEQAGKHVETFADAESFLAALPEAVDDCCLLIDAALPGISGLQLLKKLAAARIALPAVMVTGLGDIGMAVQAMKAGAADFLEKPVNAAGLLACVQRVLDDQHGHQASEAGDRDAAQRIAGLTLRQREIMNRVLAGEPSKNIAADLGISQRTVENHRAAIMLRTGAKSVPALARLAFMAQKPGKG